MLRMPEELRPRLVEAAERSGRSLNGEVVHRLEKSLRPSRRRRILDAVASAIRGRETSMLRRRNRVIALAACALLAIAVALVVGRGGGSAPATAARRKSPSNWERGCEP